MTDNGMTFQNLVDYVFDRLDMSDQDVGQFLNCDSKYNNKLWRDYRTKLDIEILKEAWGFNFK